ncbi:hypothetical protein A1O7_06793 [Cladophialophora yegresii CBS 114405]|uniref:Gfd2/YDR514C-like C-terminal domain-containing protein n=1 Tax=Cladophialophora yegresii CBS 114405 TaxID=1182544 RepID=W9WD43_9EURO|nr:uncharacterized protein A1O7_06793 [Cladophialophora yegresii CBS 114405]EXJ56449.1 hypothetical protein A1O7_06793 [Cladophialophora yegresii CBS 114405]
MSGTQKPNNGWPEGDAVVACLDVECHCRNQSYKEFQQGIRNTERRVTEIGIASFDPRRLPRGQAGDRGVNTWRHIKACNLAIKEHKHVITKKHPSWCLTGDAVAFDFGDTQWVWKSAIKNAVVRKIRTVLGDGKASATAPYHNQRPVVFLFFDTTNDVTWLEGLGIDLKREFPNSDTYDIQCLDLAMMLAQRRGRVRVSAQRVLDYLGFATTHKHNGGNDAVYELRAFIAEETLRGQFDDVEPRDLYWSMLGMHGEVLE